MPIVPGNDQKPATKSGGSLVGWIVFLLVFGRPAYNLVRSLTRGVITDQQLVIIAAGAVALIALVVIVQRVNQSRQGSATLSTTSLPTTNPSASLQQYSRPGDVSLPATPRFEPIITGKLVLAGVILALLFGSGCLVLLSLATP